MKAKLIKTDKDNYILVDSTKGVYDKGYLICSSRETDVPKLSKQNCDDIFGVVDVNSEVEAIVKTICPDDRGKDVIYGTGMAVGIQCFKKAMELNKDKVFTEEDVRKAYIYGVSNCHSFGHSAINYTDKCIQSLQQPKEIEVEIETEEISHYKGSILIDEYKVNKLNSEGCLILKKI